MVVVDNLEARMSFKSEIFSLVKSRQSFFNFRQLSKEKYAVS
jgi:hypothetical protein